MKQKIILASTSPRRRDLLKQIGLDFEIMPSEYEEDMTLKMSNKKLVKTLAYGKAEAVAKKLKSGVVIGSDTFVVFEGKRLGKPKDKKEAEKMLNNISGKWVKIYTGLAIIDVARKKELLDCEVGKVKIKSLDKKEIATYIATGEPLDKAGAFAVQERGAIFIEKVQGCFTGIIGLPLNRLYVNLKKLGINI
jgi:septum formation protein